MRTVSHLPDDFALEIFDAERELGASSVYTGPLKLDAPRSVLVVNWPHSWPARGAEKTLKLT